MSPAAIPGWRTAALGLLLAAGAGCTASPRPLAWRVRFDSAAARDATVSIEAWIARGACGSADKAYGPVSIARGEPLPSVPPTLAPARYAFVARALDASCRVVAAGCAEAQLPQPSDSEVTTVMLASPGAVACPADACVAGRCTGVLRDAGAGDDGSPPPADAPSESAGELFAEWCHRVAQLECTANATCCSDPATRYPDNDACLADQTRDCEMWRSAPSLTDGTIGFDRTRADAKLMELETDIAACRITSFGGRDLASLFVGTAPAGSDCMPTAGDELRIFLCAAPSVCGLSGTTAVCGPPKSAGAACFTTWECDVGLYCAHDGTSTGACAPLVADGGACTANEECISGFCRTTGTPAACTVPTQDELYCIEPV